MATNLDRYKTDLELLSVMGTRLLLSMLHAVNIKTEHDLSAEQIKELPVIEHEYQRWYSEALACVEQLLPSRVQDFVGYYKPDKSRKDITYANYTMSDYLKGLTVTKGGYQKEKVVGPDAAVHALHQQVQIVSALRKRLESSLFDIRTLVQADLLDDELQAADELNKKGFGRAAGAIAGVVLEEHLASVCQQHKIDTPKNSTISALNDLLKKNDVLDTPSWRSIQHLGDLRNLCDHKKDKDPTPEDIGDLIGGVRKIIKTVF
jgi:hypothetical protein